MNPKTRAELSLLDIPHPNMVTAGQIQTLLQVVATLSNSLSHSRPAALEQSEPTISGGERLAVSTSLIIACNSLDKILEDKSRWDSSFQQTIEKRADEIHRATSELVASQKAAAEYVQSPHFQFRPNLKKLPGNAGWCAFLGDLEHDPVNTIVGVGNSPEQALAAFDDVFRGTMPVHMQQWMAERQHAFSEGQIPPETPYIEKNEQTKLVRKRNRKTPRTSRSGENPS